MEPRERGGPLKEFWEDPGTIQQLESVKTWLLKNAKKVHAALIIILVNFMKLLNPPL